MAGMLQFVATEGPNELQGEASFDEARPCVMLLSVVRPRRWRLVRQTSKVQRILEVVEPLPR